VTGAVLPRKSARFKACGAGIHDPHYDSIQELDRKSPWDK
jgi:hypothetical protein